MSSPLTPFQARHQHSARSLGGVYNALKVPWAGTFPVDDVSPTSTSFSLGLCTPFDQTLLSPLDIPLQTTNTLGTSGPIGSEKGAYIQLLRYYQIMQNKLLRERQEHSLLKTTHSEIVHSHNTLLNMYAKVTKRLRTEDHAPALATRASVTPHNHHKEEESQPTMLPVYSRSDFPDIKYWTREEWDKFEATKKTSTDPTIKTGSRRKTRYANNENVNSMYLELSDGTPIGGKKAMDVRAYARSIWVDLYTRGIAPKKWSKVSRTVHEEYAREMETRWPILQYCKNHYKAHLLATKHYSQWYKTHHMAQTISNDNDKETNGPPSKKFKTMVKDDHTCVSQADTPPKDSDINNDDDNNNNNNNPKPSWLKDNVQEGLSRGILRPKARPLRDPLANAFNKCSPTFWLLGETSHAIQGTHAAGHARDTRDSDHAPSAVMRTQSPVVPHVSISGLGVSATSVPGTGVSISGAGISATSLPGPGVSATSIPGPGISISGPGVSATSLPGPGVPPPHISGPGISHPSYVFPITDTQGSSAPPIASNVPSIAPSDTDDANTPAITEQPARMKDLRSRRYKYMQIKTPGVRIHAVDMCSVNWCAANPGGTVGEFNVYWDHLDNDLRKVYDEREVAKKAEIKATWKGRLPPRRANGAN